jgi:hypothetical protein
MGSLGRDTATKWGGALSTKNQGKTGQGVSAAGFLPAQEPYDLELDTESKAKDAPGNTGNRKRRTGIDNTGYGKDAKYGDDGIRVNITTRGMQ